MSVLIVGFSPPSALNPQMREREREKERERERESEWEREIWLRNVLNNFKRFYWFEP